MKTKIWITAAVAVAATLLVGIGSAPTLASGSSQQNNKNLWRNLTIGAGAVGVNGLIHHNTTETVLGAAGAAYSANRYEKDRKSQSASQRAHRWRSEHSRAHRRSGGYTQNGKRYYEFGGHHYYLDMKTNERHQID